MVHAHCRSAPESRRQEPGEPAAVLASGQGTGSGAVNEVVGRPRHQGCPEGGEVAIPLDGMDEPTLRRASGGTRDMVLPGNKKFVEGDIIPRPKAGAAASGSSPANGDSEDAFPLRADPGRVRRPVSRRPRAARPRQAPLRQTRKRGCAAPATSTSGSPANYFDRPHRQPQRWRGGSRCGGRARKRSRSWRRSSKRASRRAGMS